MGCFPSRSKAVAPVVVSLSPPQPPPLCAAGCGKPTWNGKAGEYCSKSCRGGGSSASTAVCATPGCGKPSWNGKAGEYCSKYCKASSSGAVCLTPGCGKPTWNGQPNEYCSKVCRDNGPPVALPGILALEGGPPPGASGPPQPSTRGAVCLTPGCGKPTWNGLPGEYCSKVCRGGGAGAGTGGGAGGGTVGSKRSFCTLLQPGTQKYDSFRKQYVDKWDTGRCSPTTIRAIYEVTAHSALFDAFSHQINTIGNVKCFGHGTNPGNVQRRFHGTRMTCCPGDPWVACSDAKCSACRIVEDGFDVGKLGSWSGNKGHYGGGLYFTSMSSTAKGYGLDTASGYAFDKGNWMDPAAGNVVLIVNIACGKVEDVKSTCNHKLDRSQFDSRKVDKPSGADELIVFDSGQTLVRAMIVF